MSLMLSQLVETFPANLSVLDMVRAGCLIVYAL